MLKLFGRHHSQDRRRIEKAVGRTRQAWFGRMSRVFQRSQIDDDMWDELEELLFMADVGATTTMKLLDRLRERVADDGLATPNAAFDVLKTEMISLLTIGEDQGPVGHQDGPQVILMAGVNGVGKTTSISKLANMYHSEGKSVLLGAADTYRAAAIEQLQAWGERLGLNVIAHRQGADPGAVAFDTMQAARSRGIDMVIIDTAGRVHTKSNLMQELTKIRGVVERQTPEGSLQVILAMDATTGQNGLVQARAFSDAVECDGVFLTKLDGTAKGGMVLAIADELALPVLFIGTGEQPDDVAVFNARDFVEGLFPTGDTPDN